MTYIEDKPFKNSIGRWEVCGVELTSGTVIEVSWRGSWIKGRVEHNGDDYYLCDPEEACPDDIGFFRIIRVKVY